MTTNTWRSYRQYNTIRSLVVYEIVAVVLCSRLLLTCESFRIPAYPGRMSKLHYFYQNSVYKPLPLKKESAVAYRRAEITQRSRKHHTLWSTRYYYTDNYPQENDDNSKKNRWRLLRNDKNHVLHSNISVLNGNHLKKNDKDRTVDSLEAYARDIATVLKKLRSEERDPTIPRYFRITRMPSFTNTWSFDDWKKHTSRWRYVRYITSFPTSTLVRRLSPTLLILFVWSCVATWACAREVTMLKRAVLSLTPLSLVSTFVAGLLTLRSNQGLSRLNEGRLALGKVVLYTRDMAQMISAHVYPKDPILGLKLARHVAIFSWLLKGFLRGKVVNQGYDEDIIHTMLDPADAAYVLQQRKKPVAVVTRLRQAFSYMLQRGMLTTSEASRLDHTVQQLNYCIMVTERIQASPIPPLYTAHAGRLLVFYLFFLPLSLRGSNIMNGIGTIITTMAVGYAMLGLDEISHLVEEPFRLMPLWHLSKNSMIDCGDALVCQPPPLFSPEENNEYSTSPNGDFVHSNVHDDNYIANITIPEVSNPPYW